MKIRYKQSHQFLKKKKKGAKKEKKIHLTADLHVYILKKKVTFTRLKKLILSSISSVVKIINLKWSLYFLNGIIFKTKSLYRGKQNDLDPSPKSDLLLDQIITIQLVQFKG